MKNIILIGLMGAGKTTVGRRLSQKIGWEREDNDNAQWHGRFLCPFFLSPALHLARRALPPHILRLT